VGTAPVNDLLAYSHRCGASMTMVLCALIMQAIRSQMSVNETKKPVVLAVPVNLRNHFRSASARNFFQCYGCKLQFFKTKRQHGRYPAGIGAAVFSAAFPPKNCSIVSISILGLSKIRFLGLPRFPARILPCGWGYYSASQKETSAVSNVGVVHMPAALAPYIRQFAVFVSTEKLQMCSLSYEKQNYAELFLCFCKYRCTALFLSLPY
jgi:hypothetical protein